MTERTSDRWVSIGLSVLLHGALAGALVYGWWTFRRSEPPKPTLAIEATVVDARSVKGLPTTAPTQPVPPPAPPPTPTPEPPAPQAEPEGPPEPTADELAQRAKAQKDREEQAKAAEQKAAAEADAQREEENKRQQEAKRQDEEHRKAQQHADAERKAKEEADARKRTEERRLAEQKRLEDERRKEQEAQERAQTEAELKRNLDAEEHQNAIRSSGALASWQAQITARIQRAWLRPPTARAGIECVLDVTQVPGGEVTNVTLGACNGDQAVRESIVAAVYRASPLPAPPDPSLFERNLQITFKPD